MSFTTLENQLSRLTVLPNAMNWRGGWSVSEQYYLNDVVISPNDGYSYILTVTSLIGGVDPAGNLVDWTGIAPATGGGITAIVGGAGISIDNTNPLIPVVNNTGIITATAGVGLVNIGTANDPEFDNTGVITLVATNGITNTSTAENPILENTGLLSLAVGNGIANIGTLQDPNIENTRNTALYVLPAGGAFINPGFHDGSIDPEHLELGRFTIPSDAVPGSTALLYVSGWGVDTWNANFGLDVMEYPTFFARALDIATAFVPVFGFSAVPGNPNGVPASIFNGVPHFPASQAIVDYIQQPQWIAITNLTPSETIYAVTRFAYPYITFSNPSLTAPYLFYLKQ
jgi:hypothetical protein